MYFNKFNLLYWWWVHDMDIDPKRVESWTILGDWRLEHIQDLDGPETVLVESSGQKENIRFFDKKSKSLCI